MKWYLKVMKNYTEFNGRARRKEYWMFTLFNMLFYILAAFIDGVLGLVFGFSIIYSLVVLIPGLSVAVRRLHDVGKSGWFLLISLIPIIGGIWLLVLMCSDGKAGDNLYGPNPKES